MPEARRHPRSVVVSPRDSNMRLPGDEFNSGIYPGTTVTEVPGHNQLVDRQVSHNSCREPDQVELTAVVDERPHDSVEVLRLSVELWAED